MASLADQFVSDAGGASAVKAVSLADQFSADAAGAPAAQQPSAPTPAAQPSMWDQLGRQLGLTARAGVTGLTALPTMAGDALNSGLNVGIRGVNSALGTHIPQLQMPSQAVQQGMNAVGLPQPQNATERIVQDAASSMAGAAPSIGLGRAIPALATRFATNAAAGATSAATPAVAQAVGSGLQVAPGMQLFGAAGSGAASSGARELGLGPGWQIGAGVLGGAAGVGLGSGLTAAARGIGNAASRFTMPPMSGPAAAARADIGVDRTVSDLGPQGSTLFSPAEIDPLKQQVAQQIQQTPNASPAAVVRAQDFRNLGIQPTLGQITRDPMQFAQEMNMRGVPDVGAPLTQRMNQQNTQLQQGLFGLAGQPQDAYSAGTLLSGTLKGIDDQMAQQVSSAYNAARASSGKNLDVPLTGLAQDYAQVLNDFGDKVPSGVRNNFNQLGLLSGTQQKTFSIDSAEGLLKVINANQSNDPATNAALSQLRTGVKNAILGADDQGGVYAGPRALAAQRFALQDQVPALAAAANGSVAPDDFVRRFIVNGKTNDVLALADLLKQNNPAAYAEARNQIGGQLAQAGFGTNPGGDGKFSPTGYAKALSGLGDTKLGAFYTPDEIGQLHTIGRVGGYINSFPSAAPVNTSNTASAITGLLGTGVKRVPYIGPLIQGAQNRAFVNRALAASLSNAPATPTPSYPMPSTALASGLLRYPPPTNSPNGSP